MDDTDTSTRLQSLLRTDHAGASDRAYAVDLVQGLIDDAYPATATAGRTRADLRQATSHALPPAFGRLLQQKIAEETSRLRPLVARVEDSNRATRDAFAAAAAPLAAQRAAAAALQEQAGTLEDAAIDHRERLVSAGADALPAKLQRLVTQRRALAAAAAYVALWLAAERAGAEALAALDAGDTAHAFAQYTALVGYAHRVATVVPGLNVAAHVEALAKTVYRTLANRLSADLLTVLEEMGWPGKGAGEAGARQGGPDGASDVDTAFVAAFTPLLTLEHLSLTHPLPNQKPNTRRPLLALVPLAHPIVLRFRWHFEGDRSTNRIDRPEYPLSHILNALTDHDEFLLHTVQPLLDAHGFSDVDAVNDFTTLLLLPLASRFKRHIPQLLSLPAVLAHTVYQLLDFDGVLRARQYIPRGSTGAWPGLSDIIFGNSTYFATWLGAEEAFFNEQFYAAISAPDAFQLVPKSDYEETATAGRPTKSALRVIELSNQLLSRYTPLSPQNTLPFLLSLHIPLLQSYSSRIQSSLEAFESLAFGILPGALTDTHSATSGADGLSRLIRASISARWVAQQLQETSDSSFLISVYHYMKTTDVVPPELAQKFNSAKADPTPLYSEQTQFERWAAKGEDMSVKYVVREVVRELKPYFNKKWELITGPPEDEEDAHLSRYNSVIIKDGDLDAELITKLSLSPELNAPLAYLTSLLSIILDTYPLVLATTLCRTIAEGLSTSIYERLLATRMWSEQAAQQVCYDVECGFVATFHQMLTPHHGWEKLIGAANILALPSSAAEAGDISFSQLMQLAFDDNLSEKPGSKFASTMEDLGASDTLNKKQVQSLMRRRPECWR